MSAAILTAMVVFGGRVEAQAEVDYTFHLYVDPILGDDVMATRLNPAVTNPPNRQPLADYPNPGFPDPSGLNGSAVLQHAPYSFRTLGGPAGAVAWVEAQISGSNQIGLPIALPEGRNLRWVVIHCLPGLYGPDSSNPDPRITDDYDPASRMRYNGDEFPFRLRRGVSLQGASALDTVFDARGLGGPIIVTGAVPSQTEPAPPDYFVDSLTLRGCIADGEGPFVGGLNLTGAAIYVGGESDAVPLTISNCFLVDNSVGIAIDGIETSSATDPNLAPRIINNTLAFNAIGIWSGHRVPERPNVGYATPVVVNNVFDTRAPTDGQEDLRAPFLGVHPDDLTVAVITDNTGAGLPGGAFNAWHAGRENSPGLIGVPNYPPPSLRAPAPYPAPIVDLGPFMGTAVQPRGLLYVSDAFRLSSVGDISPHDFRLAPNVVADPRGVGPGNPLTALNPLVNRGLDLGDSQQRYGSFEMGPSNGIIIGRAPGITPVSGGAEADVFQAWDWDAEGFRNPRIRCRAGFDGFPTTVANIDLGADEMDELIMAGYVPSTRMFAVLPASNGATIATQTECYFFNLRGATYPRPELSGQLGQGFNWWKHVWRLKDSEGCIDCITLLDAFGNPIETNYTNGERPTGAPTLRSVITASDGFQLPFIDGQFKPPFMRNLECDFSPHLLNDWHHLWGHGWFTLFNFPNLAVEPRDFYACNPWYGSVFGSNWDSIFQPADNWFLYSNSAHPSPLYQSDVVEGIINPPGSYLNGPRAECGGLSSYRLPGSPTIGFGPYVPCSGASPTAYSIGPWGFGDDAAGCPDMLPLVAQYAGVRYNCQVEAGARSNLQSFLTVIGDLWPADTARSTGPTASPYRGPRIGPGQALPDDSAARALRRIVEAR